MIYYYAQWRLIITFISIYIFSFGINLMTNINNRISVRVEESIAISFIVIFSIIGIGNIEILGVSIQIVLATVLILISMYNRWSDNGFNLVS